MKSLEGCFAFDPWEPFLELAMMILAFVGGACSMDYEK